LPREEQIKILRTYVGYLELPHIIHGNFELNPNGSLEDYTIVYGGGPKNLYPHPTPRNITYKPGYVF